MADKKRIFFQDSEDRHARLRIKLKEDNLTQAKFFRIIISGYLEEDANFMEFLRTVKLANKLQPQTQQKKLDKELKKARKQKKDFLLDDSEIENLYDIIEKGNPDL